MEGREKILSGEKKKMGRRKRRQNLDGGRDEKRKNM